ncbi:MAG: SHOCT domain-containing protein [Alphaproteobacteria bacterium]
MKRRREREGGRLRIDYSAAGEGQIMWDHSFGWMPFMGIIFWLFILILVAAAVAILLRPGTFRGRPDNSAQGRSALEILEDRYARGEINREEYLQKKQDIAGRGST